MPTPVEFVSTDYRGGGAEECAAYLRAVLVSPRIVVMPPHAENVVPDLLLIMKQGGKVTLTRMSLEEPLFWRGKCRLLFEPMAWKGRFIYEYENHNQRLNVLDSILRGAPDILPAVPRA